MPRKTFDKTFKLSAVKLILEEEQFVKLVSLALGFPFRSRLFCIFSEILHIVVGVNRYIVPKIFINIGILTLLSDKIKSLSTA